MAYPSLTPDMVNSLPGMAPQGGGMFGNGKFGIGQALVAALNGYLAGTRGPGQQVGINNIQMMQQMAQAKREAAAQAAQYQQQRQDKRSDFTFEQDYKSAHDTPDIQQRIAVLNQIKPGLGDTYAQNYAANGGGLGIVTDQQTGQRYVQPGAVQPPPEAVQMLKSNPALASQFDEVFGPGASTHVLGGPTQPASGGFPQQ